MFYLIVSFAILAYRVYKAAQTDFTYGPRDSDIDVDKLFPYMILTIIGVVAWPIALPCYGIWLLGKRFKKDK
jgi:hypothetical protein